MDMKEADRKLAQGQMSLAEFIDEAAKNSPANEIKADYRRQGHRLGVFLTALGFVLILAGLVGEAGNLFGMGLFLLLFGYLLARLWYWFKAA